MWLILGLFHTSSLILSVEMLQCLNFKTPTCVSPFFTTATGEVCAVLRTDEKVSANVSTSCAMRTSLPKAYCLGQKADSSPATASIGLGFGNVAVSVSCCSTDNCNSGNLSEPNNAPNGLKCVSCNTVTDKQCKTTVSCVGIQDRCLDNTGNVGNIIPILFPFLQHATLKGCVSRNLCGPQSITKFNCISNSVYSAITNTDFSVLLMGFIFANFL
ncbi:uncharacterized protein LOC143707213 [Siphateles boraxobius]|uniref:uncharacterized protein LOC143707213 n=1 Tax=Siphateles boraxobius TaxID=180520 RepID=UPI004064B608